MNLLASERWRWRWAWGAAHMKKSSIALRQLTARNKKGIRWCLFFLPRNAWGWLTLKECDAMRAGTSHYPYTSAAHDLFPSAKLHLFPHSASTSTKKTWLSRKKPYLCSPKMFFHLLSNCSELNCNIFWLRDTGLRDFGISKCLVVSQSRGLASNM